MTTSIEEMEQQLDSFDRATRDTTLAQLLELKLRPVFATKVNLHSHTFYSYNAYGYSPSKFAWLARRRGLLAAGIVDFDVLDGLEEFWEAGKRCGLKRCISLESRVFVPEFATRMINSPGEPGIAYHMGVGFPRQIQHPLLTKMRETADQRNRELVARVNTFTAPVVLDYDRDVLPLTPNGNVTERHICEAYSKQGEPEFWQQKLGERWITDAQLQALIRSKTMKKGGVGYVQPGAGSFPLMSDVNRFILDSGAIPTLTWLDGTSDGEKDIDELFHIAIASGAAALNIIPDRNYTPGVKDHKLRNLQAVVALAEKYNFPIIVGTEMNSPGNKFVDAFETEELRPLFPLFLKGAHIVYSHSVLQRQAGLGYLSAWAQRQFPTAAPKNEFFEKLGAMLQPEREEALTGLTDDATPESILNKIK